MMMQIDRREKLQQFTPHSGPMLLVDRVLEHGDEYIVTEVDIGSRLPGFTENGLPSYVAIELMAQSVAAWSGLHRHKRESRLGSKPPIGFLLGTRKFRCQLQLIPGGSVVQINAHQVVENEGMAQFDCSMDLHHNGNVQARIAEAGVSVYSQPEI